MHLSATKKTLPTDQGRRATGTAVVSAQPCSLASSRNDAECPIVLLQFAVLDLCHLCNVNATVSKSVYISFFWYRNLRTTELLIRPINSAAD